MSGEIIDLILSCNHVLKVVDPHPYSYYLCPRCDSYETMKYAVPA